MDLGGVDVRGARDEPHEGDALFGLYQHKRGSVAAGLSSPAPTSAFFDARGYALGRLSGRLARLIRR